MARPVTRRDVMILSGAAGLALAAPRVRAAAAFPDKDISFIIPYGPGGGFDTYARAVSPVMERYLPRRVNVVPFNLSAGGGARAITQLYRARPDGHTIGLFGIPGAFILQEQRGAREFDLARFTWLGSIGPGDVYAIGVAANSPVRTVDDLRALSRTREVTFTCTGPDGTSYLASVVATQLLDIRPRFITGYGGSTDYIVATFEEQSSIPGAASAVDLGRPELSEIIVERMVAAPPDLPADIRSALTSALDQAVRDPEIVAWAARAGVPWAPRPAGQADAVFRRHQAFFQRWKQFLPKA